MSTEQPVARPKTNGAVIFALIMSLLWLGGIGSVLGLVFGVAGARQCDRTGESGHAVGVIAAVLGLLGAFAGMLYIASGG